MKIQDEVFTHLNIVYSHCVYGVVISKQFDIV